jgi:acyl dehydratase
MKISSDARYTQFTRYFDEFSIGETFKTGGITIDQCDITEFAAFSGDYSPLHTNEQYAQATPFGGRIAHGFLSIAKMSGKFNQLGYWDGSVKAMLETGWTFLKPVRPGDTIHALVTVADLKESASKTSGAITLKFDVMNQHDEKVTEGFLKLLLKKRIET